MFPFYASREYKKNKRFLIFSVELKGKIGKKRVNMNPEHSLEHHDEKHCDIKF